MCKPDARRQLGSVGEGRTGPSNTAHRVRRIRPTPYSLTFGGRVDVSRNSIGFSFNTAFLPRHHRRCRPDGSHQAHWWGRGWHEGLGLAISDTLHPAAMEIPVCTRHQWNDSPALRGRTSMFRHLSDAVMKSRALRASRGGKETKKETKQIFLSLEGEGRRLREVDASAGPECADNAGVSRAAPRCAGSTPAGRSDDSGRGKAWHSACPGSTRSSVRVRPS